LTKRTLGAKAKEKPRRKTGASGSNAPSANHGASLMSTESSPAKRSRPYAYAKRGLSAASDRAGPRRMDMRFTEALEQAIRRGTERRDLAQDRGRPE
jgi:hypothetical protein